MVEYLMVWMPLRADRRAMTALDYGSIAALIAAAIVDVVAVAEIDLTTTFNTLAGLI